MNLLAKAGPFFVALVLAPFTSQAAAGTPSRTDMRNAGQEQTRLAPAGVGAPMPEFCLNDLTGRKICSSQFRGKVLLIDFWASWCSPCKTEMPAYQKFQDAYGPKGFAVIGIGLSMDSPANLKKFARALGVHYMLLMGTMPVQDKFDLLGVPTTILVDRQGIIRARVVGFDYPAKLKPKIQSLLQL